MRGRLHRAGQNVVVLVCAGIILIAWGTRVQGEPHFAVREGYKCSQCHVNITGGGKRNGFGLIYTQTTLPATIISFESLQKLAGSLVSPDAGTFVGSRVANFLSLGGDLRVENRTTFESGSGANQVDTRNEFNLTEAELYIEANLLRDFLTFYLDQRLGPGGSSSREIFGLLRFPQLLDFYIKGGRMLLPYGWRLFDDSAFIRSRTGINYATPDTGVEFGFQPGRFTLNVAITNGTGGGAEDNLFKQITTRASVVFRHWQVGWSFAYNDAPVARRIMYGPFAGLTFGRLTLLGEVDVIEDRDAETGDTITQVAAFTSLNFLIIRGVNFKFSYEYLDPDTDVASNTRTRLVFGLEPFITQFFQLRLFYRRNESIPQRPSENADELFLEMHIFY
jgi:hypothetical protein